ncbi:MAG: potassium-transporting ATPase subunit KdpC [Coriobacteriales bacterium]|jgi:K+-transporting ATPase ATPase C chain|nr:potassium-transporting ATPase subunit KdpC [Coriobacteriales bacterium]
MKTFLKQLRPAIICLLAMTLICGVIYTVLVTGIAQLAFSKQANGSIIAVSLEDGSKKSYGSALIGQEFTGSEYLIGRPMMVSNLSPNSTEQQALVQGRIDWWKDLDPGSSADIPIDLVTASGSGVDPSISPAAAKYQVPRIAAARNISEDQVQAIIDKYTSGRFLGFVGEPSVNVLKVNLTLDGLSWTD